MRRQFLLVQLLIIASSLIPLGDSIDLEEHTTEEEENLTLPFSDSHYHNLQPELLVDTNHNDHDHHRELSTSGNYISTACKTDTDQVHNTLLQAGWIPYIVPHITDNCELTSSTSVFCTVTMTDFGINRTRTVCDAIHAVPVTVQDVTNMACHDTISGMRASIRYSVLNYVSCVAPSCKTQKQERDLMAKYLLARDIALYIEHQGTLDTCTIDGFPEDFDLLSSAAAAATTTVAMNMYTAWFCWCSLLLPLLGLVW